MGGGEGGVVGVSVPHSLPANFICVGVCLFACLSVGLFGQCSLLDHRSIMEDNDVSPMTPSCQLGTGVIVTG